MLALGCSGCCRSFCRSAFLGITVASGYKPHLCTAAVATLLLASPFRKQAHSRCSVARGLLRHLALRHLFVRDAARHLQAVSQLDGRHQHVAHALWRVLHLAAQVQAGHAHKLRKQWRQQAHQCAHQCSLGGRQGGTWGGAATTRDGGQAAHKRVVAHERFGLVKLVEKDKRGVDARDIAAQRRRQWSRLAAGSGGSPGCSPARAPCLMASCESCAQLSWAQGKETQGSRARKEAHMLRRCPVSMMVVIAVCLMAATCSAFKPSRKEGERRCILSHSAQGGSAHAAMLVRVWKHNKGNHDRR